MTTKAFAPGFARNATTDRWSRYAPLTGAVAVVLSIIGAYLLEKTDRPTSDALFAAWVGDSGESVAALVHMGDTFFGGVALFAIPMFAAAALVIRRTRVLPAWIGWLSAAVALSLVIVPLAFFGVIAGLPIWTLATSAVLTRKELQ